jgi:hypothetical protein
MVIPLLLLLAVYLVVRDLIRGFGKGKKGAFQRKFIYI